MTPRIDTPRARARRDTTPKTITRRGMNAKARAEGETIKQVRQYTDTSTNEAAAAISPDKPLTEKQRLFVKFWAEGNPILRASVMAGYADGGTLAYRMVKMPNVLKLYEQEKRLYEEASQMTRKKVMDGLLEGVQMAKFKEDPQAVIAGWREIGKMCGYYEPVRKKLDITISGNVVMDRLNRLSDAELLKIIEQGVVEASDTHLLESDDDDGDE